MYYYYYNNLIDKFQFALYWVSHSTGTALFCVYNDSVTMVRKGNGSYLVLLDVSAEFETIFMLYWRIMLEYWYGRVLQPLKYYF